jgi:hypothetical protein
MQLHTPPNDDTMRRGAEGGLGRSRRSSYADVMRVEGEELQDEVLAASPTLVVTQPQRPTSAEPLPPPEASSSPPPLFSRAVNTATQPPPPALSLDSAILGRAPP